MVGIDIRECVTPDDFHQCVHLQRRVWRSSDVDVIPPYAYVVTRHTGGFTLGAFAADGQLVGFTRALFACWRGELCYYSNILAVHPEYRNRGIGRRLKLRQREWALARGRDLVIWTFDPLQAVNAHFNLNTLGAIVRNYEVNFFGPPSSSPLHQGLDTDRLVVEWHVDSPRVRRRLGGHRDDPPPAATVVIPRDINVLKVQDPEAARAWQRDVRRQFTELFAAGLYAGGVRPSPDGSGYQYLFYQDRV